MTRVPRTVRPCVVIVALGIVAVALAGSPVIGRSEGTIASIDGAAAAGQPAGRLAPPPLTAPNVDLVSVSRVGLLDTAVIAAAQQVAAATGAALDESRGFATGLTAVRRAGVVVDQPPAPLGGLWRYPIVVSAMPSSVVTRFMGDTVGAAVTGASVVVSATTASMHHVVQGDTIDLVGASGAITTFAVGLVAPDDVIGGSEVIMSTDAASSLGATTPTRLVLSGFASRDAVDAALAAAGLADGQPFNGSLVRVRRSWWPRDPDGTLSTDETKVALGEFAFALTGSGGVQIDPAWRDANIVYTRFADIGVNSACHRAIVADLQAALTEVAQAGLTSAVDVANTNTYGGCFNPRFSRSTGQLGFLSRHTWGQPIDMNTTANPLGGTPHMDCTVVRIFRKHGFAWGGNFLSSDGMHFEWVGQPRNELQFPSKWCPNLPNGAVQRMGAGPTEAAVMFADDGIDWAD